MQLRLGHGADGLRPSHSYQSPLSLHGRMYRAQSPATLTKKNQQERITLA